MINEYINGKILSMWIFVAQKWQQSFKNLQLVCALATRKFSKKCLRCLIFAQTIVFHWYFMEIIILISIWMQVRHNGSSKLLNILIKSIFLAILSYHHRLKKKKNSILINLHHFLEHRVRLEGSSFVIHNKVLNFHN